MQLRTQSHKFFGTTISIAFIAICCGIGPSSASKNIAADEVGNPVKTCLSQHENPHMAVLFLLDESRSLTKSDPFDRRVDAVSTALSALSFNLNTSESLTDAKPLVIDVGLVGFSKNFESHSKDSKQVWTTVQQNDNSNLIRRVEEFRNRKSGNFTNYEAALAGAEQTFVEYERNQSGAGVCKVLVWLTDGSLDLDNSSSNTKREDSQKASICKSNSGVIDRLRGEEVFTIGLGLSSSSKPDFGFMSKIVAGGCGSRDALGRFTEVESANELINELFKNLTGSQAEQLQPCLGEEANTACAEVRFNSRPPLNRVYALVGLQPGIETATVIQPNSQAIQFVDNGKAQPVDTAILHSTPSFDLSTVLKIDVANNPGQWRIQFRGSSVQDALVSSVFFSDVQVDVLGMKPVRINRHEPTAILAKIKGFSLDGLEASNVTTTFDSTPVLRASLIGGNKQITPTPIAIPTAGGIDTYSIQLSESDLEGFPSNSQLSLTPEAVLGGHSIVFQTVTVPIAIRLGDGLPSILKVTASNVDGKKNSRVEIKVAGPEEGLGHVRIVKDSFKVLKYPAQFSVSKVSFDTDSMNVDVAASSESSLTGSINPGSAANGRLAGTFQVELEGEHGEREVVPVAVSFNMTKPFSVGKLLSILILMTLIFILVQALVLFIAADRLSRIGKVPDGTWHALFYAKVNGDGRVEVSPTNDWRAMLEASGQPIESQTISGSRSANFGNFVIRGDWRKGFRALIFKGESALDIVNHRGVVVGSGSQDTSRPEVATINPSLAGQWAVMASFDTAQRLSELSETSDDYGVEFSFETEVLIFIDNFSPDAMSVMIDDIRMKLDYGSIREKLALVGKNLANLGTATGPKDTPKETISTPPPGDDIYR